MLDDNLIQSIQIMGWLCVCVWIAWLIMNNDNDPKS